jgi:hypothetical protein
VGHGAGLHAAAKRKIPSLSGIESITRLGGANYILGLRHFTI